MTYTIHEQSTANGVQPGDLDHVLELIDALAEATGKAPKESASLVNRIAATDHLDMATIEQLSDDGLPAFSALAWCLAVTPLASVALVKAGKVDFQMFLSVLDRALEAVDA